MRRAIAYSGLFSAVVLVSVLAHLPAQVAFKPLPLPEGLQLNGIEGTLWKGKIAQVQWQQTNLGDLNWDLHLSRLLLARLQADVRFGRGSINQLRGKGVVGVGLTGPYADHLLLSLPAEQALPWLSLPFPLTVQGQLELTLQHYRFAQPYCQQAQGSLVWSAAQVVSPLATLDLGNVLADFSCQDSVITAQGGQQTEQVSSQFNLTLQPDHRYQVQAWFQPQDAFPDGLKPSLNWLPTPDAQGRYRFNPQGQL